MIHTEDILQKDYYIIKRLPSVENSYGREENNESLQWLFLREEREMIKTQGNIHIQHHRNHAIQIHKNT